MDSVINSSSSNTTTAMTASTNGKLRSSNSMSGDSISLARVSAEEMDEKRQQQIAYEYLCHLEEVKK